MAKSEMARIIKVSQAIESDSRRIEVIYLPESLYKLIGAGLENYGYSVSIHSFRKVGFYHVPEWDTECIDFDEWDRM